MEKIKSAKAIDEKIRVTSYNPKWPNLFETEARKLWKIFGKKALDIQHFGSTAVPGLRAKPIVDILIGLRTLELDKKCLRKLAGSGYRGFGEAGVPGRLYFRKRRPHSFNLALTRYGSDLWKNNLILRDYLRSHSKEVKRYAKQKEEAIQKGRKTLIAYSDAKQLFISRLLGRARSWSQK